MLLDQIFIYPIKSCKGIELLASQVTPLGLVKDRQIMLVDQQSRFISQRQFPQMALVTLKLDKEIIRVDAPGMPTLEILSFSKQSMRVDVWGDKCQGFLAEDGVNQWFSKFLNQPLKLVYYDHSTPRPCDPVYSKPGDAVSYADGFPLLVTTTASLLDLNRRLENPVSMHHFRPNIVVQTNQAFAEDHWKRIKVGEVEFDVVKPCSRCVLTTVDPETGVKSLDTEPLKTLAKYRKTESGIIFGMNLIPRNLGEIRQNDTVTVLN